MTRPDAIRQFIAICGGPALDKGACVIEPLASYGTDETFVIGQTDYIASSLHPTACGGRIGIMCPFEPYTALAAGWAAGKLYERRCERAVVEAYARRVA